MDTTTKRTDLLLVHPSNIVILNDFNTRIDYGDIEGLAESIRLNGIEVPLKAKKVRGSETFELVDGHRRMKAVQLLIENGHDVGLLPIMSYTGNAEDRIFSLLITGTDQKSLTDIEQAEAVKRLVKLNYEVKDIAGRLGKSLVHIYNLLQLADAPKEVKDMVNEGSISGSTIVSIMKETPDEVIEVAKTAVADAKAKGKKKATNKNVVVIKNKSISQKIAELSGELKEKGIENERTKFYFELVYQLKNGSVSDLVKIFEEETI